MTLWRLYHNPKCSKSREALRVLEDSGVTFEVIECLQTPPTQGELKQLIAHLRGPVSELVRSKEAEFLSSPFDVNAADLVADRLAKSPGLLERPILWGPAGAIVGRPVERISQLLSQHPSQHDGVKPLG
jgi:arsenate reductase